MVILIRQFGLEDLVDLCRSMRFALSSGMMLLDVMELLAERGTVKIRKLATEVHQELKAGWSLQDALQKQTKVLPPLFRSLVTVGEESGNLPEVLAELETYYQYQLKLRREFTSQVYRPVTQFVAAVLIIALLIYILGVLPVGNNPGSKPFDALGLGLRGPAGAVKFLLLVTISISLAIMSFVVLKRLLRGRAVVERFLLVVPGVGTCLRALAMARFCIAGRLLLETSMSVLKTLGLAFQATDNAAFVAAYPRVEASLRQGNSIVVSFGKAGVFPARFLSTVSVGEESGRLPETLRHQAEEYDDQARRWLSWLTGLAGNLVWLTVAAVIVTCIIRIFSNVYLSTLENVIPK